MKLSTRLIISFLVIIVPIVIALTSIAISMMDDSLQKSNKFILNLELDNSFNEINTAYKTLENLGVHEVDQYINKATDDISKKIDERKFYHESLCIFIMKTDKSIIYHKEHLNGNEKHSDNFLNNIVKKKNGSIEYLYNNQMRFATFKEFKGFNWIIVCSLSKEELFQARNNYVKNAIFMAIILTLLSIIIIYSLSKTISKPITKLVSEVDNIAKGDYISCSTKNNVKEIIKLYKGINDMSHALNKERENRERRLWISDGDSLTNNAMRGKILISELSNAILAHFAKYLGAEIGSFYYYSEKESILKLSGTYAINDDNKLQELELGKGLLGEVAKNKKIEIHSDLQSDYMKINSSIGETSIKNLIIVPVYAGDVLKGVFELGFIKEIDNKTQEFLSHITENIAMAVDVALKSELTQSLLEDAQRLSEELQAQQEELKVSNEELEEQTQKLKVSENDLKAQNNELEVKQQEVEVANKNLARSGKYKSEFLANMSHELRTPLNSLMLLSKGLSNNNENNLNKEQIEDLDFIYNSGYDLLTLVNDILDLSKVEAGKLIIHSEAVILSELFEKVHKLFSSNAKDKNLEFNLIIDKDVPKEIMSDSLRIEQILKNLLSNAFKFTKEGKVDLIVKKVNNTIAVSVSDTGIGISKEKQSEIFEAFKQEDGSTSRKYGGTGLGLTISRELAELLGCELVLESEQGKGCKFTLSLPIKTSEIIEQKEETHKIEKTYEILPALHNKKILIIDDDARNVFALAKLLKESGMKVITASNGQTGIELLDSKIDLILMDIMMPVMDGYETISKIRSIEKYNDLPIIAQTAKAMEKDRIDCINAGANDYLTKPLDYDKLLSILTVWLHK